MPTTLVPPVVMEEGGPTIEHSGKALLRQIDSKSPKPIMNKFFFFVFVFVFAQLIMTTKKKNLALRGGKSRTQKSAPKADNDGIISGGDGVGSSSTFGGGE